MTRCFALLVALTIAQVAAAAEPKVAERWAVLIGVDDYANANDLQYCGADQKALRDRLITSGFRAENIVLLHDKASESKCRPSQRAIEQQLRLTISNAAADDLLVVGFSGHGVSIAGKSYLCPGDALLGDATTLISLDGVYDQLRDCDARLKFVLVDACRNDPTLGGQRSISATEGTRQLARSLEELKLPQGVVLFNSCATGEISWEETAFGHGVFMNYILEGLDGKADTDTDGAVSINELQRYATARTKAYVTNKFNSTQRPFCKSEGEGDAMDFALLPVNAAARTRRTLPPAASAMPKSAPGIDLTNFFNVPDLVLINQDSNTDVHVRIRDQKVIVPKSSRTVVPAGGTSTGQFYDGEAWQTFVVLGASMTFSVKGGKWDYVFEASK